MNMNTVFLVVVFCLMIGAVAAVLWPQRQTQQARTFVLVAVATAAIVAAVNAWKKAAKLR